MQRRAEWLAGMTISNLDVGQAVLSGPVPDQARCQESSSGSVT
jgi:hypothetical protein